ncbi:hypothetical protein NQZ68_004739 [Dissostichus eleginoides]|nr:hypothetical protein NQZ68_004739 [Dissostichus eleginoides]
MLVSETKIDPGKESESRVRSMRPPVGSYEASEPLRSMLAGGSALACFGSHSSGGGSKLSSIFRPELRQRLDSGTASVSAGQRPAEKRNTALDALRGTGSEQML